MNILTLMAFLGFVQLASAESLEISCKPSDFRSTIFDEITVGKLQGAAQELTQIRGDGIFTAVDLLCAMDNCVGFVNRIPTKGSLLTEGGVLKSVKIYAHGFRVDYNFTCE